MRDQTDSLDLIPQRSNQSVSAAKKFIFTLPLWGWILMGEEIQMPCLPSHFQQQLWLRGAGGCFEGSAHSSALALQVCAQPGWGWRLQPAKLREFQAQLSLLLGWTPSPDQHSPAIPVPWIYPRGTASRGFGNKLTQWPCKWGKNCISKKNAADRKCISFLQRHSVG